MVVQGNLPDFNAGHVRNGIQGSGGQNAHLETDIAGARAGLGCLCRNHPKPARRDPCERDESAVHNALTFEACGPLGPSTTSNCTD